MKVFKFGGASVKDAAAVKNVAEVLKAHAGEKLVVVISAMGKMTNALEALFEAYFYGKEDVQEKFDVLKRFHQKILADLFPDQKNPIYDVVNNLYVEIDWVIEDEPEFTYDKEYDQIVSIGEMLSTKIVSVYLNEQGISNQWVDVRDMIRTDDSHREGKIDWEFTEQAVKKQLQNTEEIVITQGFIGCTDENYTTTLGREGSDFSAAIIAYCVDAESVTIWKDVPGVLNADPKWFDDTQKIDSLSYYDATELAYYGATVIHPKTIKPLQNKNIPLYVRSFMNWKEEGTLISKEEKNLPIPSFIFKIDQVLISISPKDYSFIVEANLSNIFQLFAAYKIKINLMENSAMSFSVCADKDDRVMGLIDALQIDYAVRYNDENVELITIRHYDEATIDRVMQNKKLLVEHKSRTTVQLVVVSA